MDLQQLKNMKVDYQDGIAVVQFSQENSKVRATIAILTNAHIPSLCIQVNTLSRGMMDEFVPVFQQLQNDDKVKGIVVMSAKPGTFIAGADIK